MIHICAENPYTTNDFVKNVSCIFMRQTFFFFSLFHSLRYISNYISLFLSWKAFKAKRQIPLMTITPRST